MQADLAEALEDELYSLREQNGNQVFPKSAFDYLNDWANPDKAWLRKFYRHGSDEPFFDLTPATEKAIAWLATLGERSFIGTESRLLTLFELLRQMSEGSDSNPDTRLAELYKRKADLDAEIERTLAGEISVLDDTALKDRFQQFIQLARELLSDFREVEQNFRGLDRRVRERITLWQGTKGELLQDILGERDAIIDSDQGRSFRAFWDFLMSSRRQQELSALLDRVLELPAIVELKPTSRIRRVHYDWLDAGDHTQRTVAQLSQQLRRFLDDQAWLENRRIMDILHDIEAKTLAIRQSMPNGEFTNIADTSSDIELPMERPLYAGNQKPLISQLILESGEAGDDASALYSQIIIDTEKLKRHIRNALQDRSQISLSELISLQPLQHGLAELVAYLQLAENKFQCLVDDSLEDTIPWIRHEADGSPTQKQARLPRIIFVRAL